VLLSVLSNYVRVHPPKRKAFIRYWAGLYREETQHMIKDGVEVMMKTALKLIGKQEDRKHVPALEGRNDTKPTEDEYKEAQPDPVEE
jgi:hypothetical protein